LASEHRQIAAVDDALAWLDDGLRETKSQLLRLEQNLQQSDARIAELNGRLHASDDSTAAVSRRLGDLNSATAQVAQIHQAVAQIEEQVRESERRFSEALRLQQQETERYRLELNGALRRIELLERQVEGWGARFENVESTIGRLQEALTLTRQRAEENDRRQDTAELHASRATEAQKRSEKEIGRLQVEVESQARNSALVLERTQAFGEAMKRLEQQLDGVSAEVTAQHDIFERIDLLRAEMHRIEDRIAGTETQRDLDHQEIDDHQRLLSLLDGKGHGFADRLSMLQGELVAYRDLVTEQFNRLHLTLDRQKRHQIEELQRELRDLQVNAFRPPEELEAGEKAQ
jgi:chromosome segregation ATPase